MTDDFHLFADPDDGDRAIDPDVAFVSAYLARELSPMQMLAVEERLATDPEFRAVMQPLLDLWAAPVASLEGGKAQRAARLSPREEAIGWRRFQQEASVDRSIIDTTQRRVSMKRVAAVIGITILPVFSFAQVVSYAAKHPETPGHGIARRVVATFQSEGVTASPRSAVVSAVVPEDTPVSRQLNVPTAPVAANPTAVAPRPVLSPAILPEPDRAKIAELARQRQPAVVRGDTAAEYIVMVLDAADKYLWSTFGNGNLDIEVGGDTRTAAERRVYQRDHRAEFWGDSKAGEFARYALARPPYDTTFYRRDSSAGGGGGAAGGRGRGAGTSSAPDSAQLRLMLGAKRSRDSLSRPRYARVDSGSVARFDSFMVAIGTARGGAGGRKVMGDSIRVVGSGASGGRGRGALTFDSSSAAERRVYTNGWGGSRNGPLLNQAYGLQTPGAGQSGIQGVTSAWVASADTYFFGAGELGVRPLKVMVVHLTADAKWKGR